MSVFASLIIAILPIFLVLGIYYLAVDRSWLKKKRTFLIFFLAGAISSVPSYFTEAGLISVGLYDWGFWSSLLEAFIYVSVTEELYKWIAYYLIYRKWSSELTRPIDYITSGILVGLGFALTENIMYALLFDWQTMLVRLFTAVPAHVAFGIVMGYYFYKYSVRKKPKYLWWSFLIPVALHGLYDIFIVQDISDNLLPGALVVLLGNYIWGVFLIKKLKRQQEVVARSSVQSQAVFPNIDRYEVQEEEDYLGDIILGEEE